ncbi:MAG: class I SAM-dependent methyltransferase [Allosphingosinicella sp.]|uniref:class I SAM-dependent methyltransferase n=1 Tax=Allosphingosinicella sp. TaxID=2823234 RepID=UPI0039566149
MKRSFSFYDVCLAPFVAVSAISMRLVRRRRLSELPITRSVLNKAGVFPLRKHYYEPLYDASDLRKDQEPRVLPGIDFNREGQVALLSQLGSLPAGVEFDMSNANFGSGDAETWYNMIRHLKPRRIIEIGSGYSTRMAALAVAANKSEDAGYSCEHICIEPYEMPWLEEIGVTVVRKKLEDVDPALFSTLSRNDILFIDSSHIIRPQGEVLLEYLQILPTLASGVVVHVHDIFSPRDYPMVWLEIPLFWNEQYLLEAFLSHNSSWTVMLGVNMMKHEQYDLLKRTCPHLTPEREPGSFYLVRN